ncbi:O-antigen ligase family protein [Candidatus Falkowbacteria bacterium]|nr:O-antigen ligase family protein [Candidatus Falkowbacteria bacterium]
MSKEKLRILIIATGLAILAVPFIFFKTTLALGLGFLLLYYLIIIIILKPKLGLFLLIIIRPCLDILTDRMVLAIGGFNLNLASLIGIITLGFGGVLVIKNRNTLKKVPLIWPIVLFLGITLGSLFLSMDTKVSLGEFVRLLSMFGLYVLGYFLIKDKKDFRALIKVIIFSAVIPSIFAVWQFFTKTGISVPLEGVENRIFGTFAFPTLYAYFLIIPIVLSFYLMLRGDKQKLSNALAIILLPVLVFLMAMTYTRGAWLALSLILIALGVIKYRKFLMVFLAIILCLYLLVEPINERINSQYGSIRWRADTWEQGLGIAKEKIILGHGTGVAEELILKKRGEDFGSADVHNDYLKILLENGVFGFLAYIFIIFGIFYKLGKKYFKAKGEKERTLVLIMVCLAGTLYLISFFSNAIKNTAMQWTWWVFLGAFFRIYPAPEGPHPIADKKVQD